jgi:hypothetical protein
MTRFAFEKRLGRFSKHLEPRLTNDKRKVVSF